MQPEFKELVDWVGELPIFLRGTCREFLYFPFLCPRRDCHTDSAVAACSFGIKISQVQEGGKYIG